MSTTKHNEMSLSISSEPLRDAFVKHRQAIENYQKYAKRIDQDIRLIEEFLDTQKFHIKVTYGILASESPYHWDESLEWRQDTESGQWRIFYTKHHTSSALLEMDPEDQKDAFQHLPGFFVESAAVAQSICGPR